MDEPIADVLNDGDVNEGIGCEVSPNNEVTDSKENVNNDNDDDVVQVEAGRIAAAASACSSNKPTRKRTSSDGSDSDDNLTLDDLKRRHIEDTTGNFKTTGDEENFKTTGD